MIELEREIDRLFEMIRSQTEIIKLKHGSDVNPYAFVDPTGRPLLLDAQTALVNGLAALAVLKKTGR